MKMPVEAQEVARAIEVYRRCSEQNEFAAITKLGVLELLEAYLAFHANEHPHRIKDTVVSIARFLMEVGETSVSPDDKQQGGIQRKANSMLIWTIPYRIIPRDAQYAELNAEMFTYFAEHAEAILALTNRHENFTLREYLDDAVFLREATPYFQVTTRVRALVRLHHFDPLLNTHDVLPESIPLLVSEIQSTFPEPWEAKHLALSWALWNFWPCQGALDSRYHKEIQNDLFIISTIVRVAQRHFLYEERVTGKKVIPWKHWKVQCVATLQLLVNQFLQTTQFWQAPTPPSTPVA